MKPLCEFNIPGGLYIQNLADLQNNFPFTFLIFLSFKPDQKGKEHFVAYLINKPSSRIISTGLKHWGISAIL
jgi:hypothetical protein